MKKLIWKAFDSHNYVCNKLSPNFDNFWVDINIDAKILFCSVEKNSICSLFKDEGGGLCKVNCMVALKKSSLSLVKLGGRAVKIMSFPVSWFDIAF